MAQVFTISDGTTTIDLLNTTGNYHLAEWETGISEWKNGGIYSDNPLTDGSVPIDRSYSNFEEKITVHITGTSQNNVITNLRSLFNLLDKSINYFTENLATPVYLSAKGDTETGARYAVIVGYKIDKLPDQFIGPFLNGGKQSGLSAYTSIYKSVELILQRGHWLDNVPGSSDSISISNQYTYNGTTYGQSASSSVPILLSSRRAEANITHVYRFDNSASSWSGNQVGTLPFNLLPTSTTASDAVYIGIQSTLTDSGPFSNVVFNVGTAASGITGDWEYWTGVAWATIIGVDATRTTPSTTMSGQVPFTKTGVGFIEFRNPMGTGNLLTILGGSAPNITGYWIRFRVTSVSSPVTPTQQTNGLFFANRPYIDINSASIGGDIPTLSKLIINGKSGARDYSSSATHYTASSIWLGVRKYSKGSLFTPYINIADEQNPSGITVSAYSGVVNEPGSTQYSSVGRVGSVTVTAGTTNGSGIDIEFASTIANHFFGKFRVFLRYVMATNVPYGDVLSSMTVYTSECDLSQSDTKVLQYRTTAIPTVADFGLVNLIGSNQIANSTATDTSSFSIKFAITNNNASNVTIYFTDLILIPADESIIEIRELLNDATGAGFDYSKNLEIDNLTYPEKSVRAITKNVSTNVINGIFRPINSKGLEIPTERCLLCFLFIDRYIPILTTNTEFLGTRLDNSIVSLLLKTNNRYLLPRGDV